MIIHENRLADDSYEIAYLIFCRKLGKMSQNVSSASVVIGPLRGKKLYVQFNCVDPKNNKKCRTCRNIQHSPQEKC